MPNFAGQHPLTLLRASGRTVLDNVESLEISAEENLQAVKTMNKKRRVRGFSRSTAEFSGSLSVAQELNGGVPWQEMRDSGEEFLLLGRRGVGGEPYTLSGCNIGSVSESASDGETSKFDIEFMFIDLQ